MEKDFSDFLVRCSNIGLLMSNSKGSKLSKKDENRISALEKKYVKCSDEELQELESLVIKREELSNNIALSSSCIDYLLTIYQNRRYGARYQYLKEEDFVSHSPMSNGTRTELDSLKMLSKVTGKKYYKYKSRISNDYLIGALDAIDNKSFKKSNTVIEIKGVTSIKDILRRIGKPIENKYYLQMQGYLAITGKQFAELTYCVMPIHEDIVQEQKRLFYKKYENEYDLKTLNRVWKKKEVKLRLNDIPINEKVLTYIVERDEELISKICDRVIECRKWLNQFNELHLQELNKLNYAKKSNT